MPFARSDLLSEANPSNGTFGFGTGAYTTAGTVTTLNNSYLVVIVGCQINGGTGGAAAALTCAGGSLAYTKQISKDSSAADPFSTAIAIFTAPVVTGATFALTLDAGALDIGGYFVTAHCYPGYDTSTPVGAIGSKVLANDGADSLTLNSTPATTSEVIGGRIGGVATTGTVAATPGTNHTEVYDLSNTDQGGMQVQVQNIGTASTTFSWADVSAGTAGTGMSEMCGAAIEIRAGGYIGAGTRKLESGAQRSLEDGSARVLEAGPGATTLVVANATHAHTAANVVLVIPGLPGAPTGLTATTSSSVPTTVNLAWTAPASDGGSAITDYLVQYRAHIVQDTFSGSSIDTNEWVVYNRLGDQANSEVNAVIPANVRVTGGSLFIDSKFEDVVAGDTTTAAPNPRTVHYTSGQIAQARPAFLYGSVQVRAKICGGTGTWPCIWMLGTNWQASQPFTADDPAGQAGWPTGGWWEVDIAEFISGHRTLQNCALHFVTANRGGSGEKTLPFDATTRFMVYRLDWTSTSMTWLVDAEDGAGWRTLLTITGVAGTDIPNTAAYLIIHTAIGGFGGTPNSATFPVSTEVDWVQVVPWATFSHSASTATSIAVTGLDATLSYDFQVAAVNAVGTGPFSNIALVTELVVANATHGHTATSNVVISKNLVVANSTHAHTAGSPALVKNLVVQSATHAHTAANVALGIPLTVASASHGHTAGAVTLVASPAVQNASHGHTATTVALIVNLVVANSTHAHTATNVSLAGAANLVVANTTHSHTASNVSLVVNLVVQGATHAHSATNVALGVPLTVQSATHAHTAGAVQLVVNLVVASATHGHTAANVVISKNLVVQSATHSHVATNVAVGVPLIVANATHGHVATTISLGVGGSVSSASHAVTSTNVALNIPLIVASATHAHVASSVTLALPVTLVVQSATHSHTATSIKLVVNLVVASATHGHTAPNVVLSLPSGLGVQNATHGHTATNVSLTGVHTLAIQSGVHAHIASTVTLITVTLLVVANTRHVHLADSVTVVTGGTPLKNVFYLNLDNGDVYQQHTTGEWDFQGTIQGWVPVP